MLKQYKSSSGSQCLCSQPAQGYVLTQSMSIGFQVTSVTSSSARHWAQGLPAKRLLPWHALPSKSCAHGRNQPPSLALFVTLKQRHEGSCSNFCPNKSFQVNSSLLKIMFLLDKKHRECFVGGSSVSQLRCCPRLCLVYLLCCSLFLMTDVQPMWDPLSLSEQFSSASHK